MINLLKDNLEQFIQDLAKEFQSNKDIKISELLNTYINNKIEDFEKKEKEIISKEYEKKINNILNISEHNQIKLRNVIKEKKLGKGQEQN